MTLFPAPVVAPITAVITTVVATIIAAIVAAIITAVVATIVATFPRSLRGLRARRGSGFLLAAPRSLGPRVTALAGRLRGLLMTGSAAALLRVPVPAV